MDNDHQGPEDVHADGDEALLALGAVILDSKRLGIAEHPVALGERHAMLSDVCRVLLRVEIGGHRASICTLYIYVNLSCSPELSTNALFGFTLGTCDYSMT